MRFRLEIIKSNLRHYFPAPFLTAAGILLLTAALFPPAALKGKDVGKPLEYFLPFVGAALLTPIFWPEQDDSIRDVIESKKTDCCVIWAVRLLCAVAALLIFIAVFTGIMRLNECEVRWVHFYGGFASALFMGSIGFMVSGLSGNTIAGYMAVFLYYLACFGLKKQLGPFWLFRMSVGLTPDKTWLLLGSIAFIGVTFTVRRKWKRR